MSTPPLTLSQTQVCEYTGYSVATVRMLERKGYLLKLPLTGRYARADVERLVEDLRNANAAKRRTLGGPETDTPGQDRGVRSDPGGSDRRSRKKTQPHPLDIDTTAA